MERTLGLVLAVLGAGGCGCGGGLATATDSCSSPLDAPIGGPIGRCPTVMVSTVPCAKGSCPTTWTMAQADWCPPAGDAGNPTHEQAWGFYTSCGAYNIAFSSRVLTDEYQLYYRVSDGSFVQARLGLLDCSDVDLPGFNNAACLDGGYIVCRW